MNQEQSKPIVIPNKVRDDVIISVARRLNKPVDLVDKIVAFQFKDAREAMKVKNQVEISGIGKFLTKPVKLKKLLGKFENTIRNIELLLLKEKISEERKRNLNLKLENLYSSVEYLKAKLNLTSNE